MSTKSDPIVVGVDGTPASERALSWAMDEAAVRGCPLHVVNAWSYEPMTDWQETSAQRRREESEALIEKLVRAASEKRQEVPEIVAIVQRLPAHGPRVATRSPGSRRQARLNVREEALCRGQARSARADDLTGGRGAGRLVTRLAPHQAITGQLIDADGCR